MGKDPSGGLTRIPTGAPSFSVTNRSWENDDLPHLSAEVGETLRTISVEPVRVSGHELERPEAENMNMVFDPGLPTGPRDGSYDELNR